MISQPALMICAAVLLGRRRSLFLIVPVTFIDVAIAVYQNHGGQLPLVFPSRPVASLIHVLFAFGLLAAVYRSGIGALSDELERARRQFAEAAQARERILWQNQLLAQSPDPIVARDMSRSITYWSPAATRLFGWTEEEALGRSIVEILPGATGPVQQDAILSAVELTGIWSGELALVAKSGTVKVVETRVAGLHNGGGALVGVASSFGDASESNRAQTGAERGPAARPD